MGKPKSNPDGLSAHVREEGSSDASRTAFLEVVNRLTPEQRKNVDQRVLDGRRKVSAFVFDAALTAAAIDSDQRELLWEQFFSGPPDTIAEYVRRRTILGGGIRPYAETVGFSHETICNILRTRNVEFPVLQSLLKKADHLPWDKDTILVKWRREYETHLMRKYEINIFAARIRMAFSMRPDALLEKWTRPENVLPPSLSQLSKNAVKQLVKKLRSGERIEWESVQAVLDGLGCPPLEIEEIKEAWQNIQDAPEATGDLPPIIIGSETEIAPIVAQPEGVAHVEMRSATRAVLDESLPVVTGTSPHADISPATVAASIDTPRTLDVNAHVGTEKATPAPAPRKRLKRTAKEPKKGPVVDAEAQVRQVASESDVQVETTREPSGPRRDESITPSGQANIFTVSEQTFRLFDDNGDDGAEEEMPSEHPDFSEFTSVWHLGEYLRNFFARGSAGYGKADAAFLSIAEEVNRRAQNGLLGINDAANVLKMLAYSYGRFPEHEGTQALMAALTQIIQQPPEEIAMSTLMSLMLKEPRFRAFLIYYRDVHPDSEVTCLFQSLCRLSDLTEEESFDPDTVTEEDTDYLTVLRPPPRRRTVKKEKTVWGGKKKKEPETFEIEYPEDDQFDE
jgi:hypothetical protein